MPNTIKYFFTYLQAIVLGVSMVCLSCNKLVTVPQPLTLLSGETVFNSDQSATAAMNGLYASMMRTTLGFANSAMSVYPGMSADEFTPTSTGSYTPFAKNALTASTGTVASLWTNAYNYMYQANAIIEGVTNSKSITAPVRQELCGQAYFLRAFCHFYLVNLFGDIPVITSTAAAANANMPRTAASSAYNRIELDLMVADSLLGTDIVAGTANKWAAKALLARTLLYEKKYAAAITTSSAILKAGLFSLSADLSKVFAADSKETIFQLVPVYNTLNTYEGNLFIPASGKLPTFALTNFLLNAFEPGDKRKSNWINTSVVNGITYSYPYKYKIKSTGASKENEIVIRLAEIYLIRAEAYAQLNNFAAAQNDLNAIRNRAGLPNTTTSVAADFLTEIQKERQTELFSEWGHRWFDLKRTHAIDTLLSLEKPADWKTTDALYPIPAAQLTLNPALVQNPGY